VDELRRALTPVLEENGLELVELEVLSSLVRVTVDRTGGVDLEALSVANRVVSRVLDDVDPFPGHYTLEVSSPGLERPLRRPEHFRRAVGSAVSVRLLPGSGEVRRITGQLSEAGEDGFVVAGPEVPGGSQAIRYEDVERARTVFEWAGGGTPGKSGAKGGSKGSQGSKGSPGRSGRSADAERPGGRPAQGARGEEVTRK
jgi:ribosome maturation factor RimP